MAYADSDKGSSWQFVNLSAPQQTKNVALQKIVRVNAAKRRHRRSQKSELRDELASESIPHVAVESLTANSGPTSASSSDFPGQFQDDAVPRLWTDELDQLLLEAQTWCNNVSLASRSSLLVRDKQHNPHQEKVQPHVILSTGPDCLLGSGNLDPFTSFPIQDSPQNSELLSYCESLKRCTTLRLFVGSQKAA